MVLLFLGASWGTSVQPVAAQSGGSTQSGGGSALIRGEIRDARSGQPLVGASVVIRGTTQGATTDLNGKFSIEDQNANFAFSGKFEYFEGKAFLDFTADIHRIDFEALHLSGKPFSLEGKINARISGSGLSDFTGNLGFNEMKFKFKDSVHVQI